MKKSKFIESQVVAILHSHEQGIKVAELCREHGISPATFYQWQRKYGGLQASDLKRLREMEAELSQFKRIVADLTLQNRMLKDVIEKKL